MISDMVSENSDKKRTVKFEYTAKYKTLEQKVSYDAQIPLTDENPIDEIISHIYVTNKVLPLFYEDIANAFHRFIDEETWKYETEMGDAIINAFLNECDSESDPPYVREFPEMSSLIRARDFELDRMYRKCEQAVNASITKDDRMLPKSGQHLSRLNEQIREISKNYAEQIRTLTSWQRQFYRNMIKSLYEHDKFPAEAESALSGDLISVKRPLPSASSLDTVKTKANFSLDESFTIYLGNFSFYPLEFFF
uniref:Uncharacterized protein n=1 Tax=Wuchereria bancrofti TaxID=6293 RepID=A0A1I8EXR6_WUCBA